MASRRGRTRKAAAPPPPPPISGDASATFEELGVTGLRTTGGRVYEEFLPQLQGSRATAVYREMSSNDSVCGAMLRAIEMLIRRVEWRVEPGSEASADVLAAEFTQTCIEDLSETWPDTLSQVLSFLPYGYSLHEIAYKRRLGPNVDPRLHSKYSDGRIGWSRLPPRAQETIDHWVWDDSGTLLGAVQVAPPDHRPRMLPWERLMLFRTSAEKANPEGKSVLRTAYRSWHFKKRMEEIEGIGIERDLAGLPVAHVPPDLLQPNAPPDVQLRRSQFAEMLRNIRQDQRAGILFPLAYDEEGRPKYKLELLSTAGRRQFDTTAIINRYDARIAMSVLADFVLLGHEQVGSFALASSKTDLFAVAIGAWLDVICEQFNRFAIPRLIRLNPFTVAEMPKLVHGDIETVDLAEISAYVRTLVDSGVIVPTPALERHLLANAGLPEPEEEEQVPADPQAEPAPAKPGQQQGQPPQPGAADPGVAADDAVSASQLALNGAQVTSLLDTLRAVADGEIPRESAIAVLVTAFAISEGAAHAMVDPIEVKEKQEPPPLPPPNQLPPPPPPGRRGPPPPPPGAGEE